MSSPAYHHPTRRELAGPLFDRLDRVHAATTALHALVRVPDSSPTAIGDALQALERDLELASREAEAARERITR